MRGKCIVILFVLSLASCKCGLSNLFNEWTDALNPQVPKCRERREAEENGPMAEITNSALDRTSLMDIEEGKLAAEAEQGKEIAAQGYTKTKRCSKGGYLGFKRNQILGASRKKVNSLPLVKRESDDHNTDKCTACMAQPACRLYRNCEKCNQYCKDLRDENSATLNDQVVAISNRMGPVPAKSDNIFSKTLYPISTYREGETKNIICRIVGITDASDIETVTIWVTTFSNNPPVTPGSIDQFTNKDPRKQENLSEHKLKQAEPNIANRLTNNDDIVPGTTPTPTDLKPRFNYYEDNDKDDSFVPKMRNFDESFQKNPDLIQGPPPLLRSINTENMAKVVNPQTVWNTDADSQVKDNNRMNNQEIIVQPKEFESDESNEEPTLPIPMLEPDQTPKFTTQNDATPLVLPELKEIESTIKESADTVLNRIKELSNSRTKALSDIKSARKPVERHSNTVPSKGGFFQNLLKTRQATPENNKFTPSSSPIIQRQDLKQNMDVSPTTDTKLSTNQPGQSDDKISKINAAVEEVRELVKNMQAESQKSSNKRLLGSTHIDNISDPLVKKTADLAKPHWPSTNPIHSAVPQGVVNNLKEVNQYLIDRAQDTLDTIGHPENIKESPNLNSDLIKNEHSDMTKKIILDFKKMPQFILDKLKDGINELQTKSSPDPSSNFNVGSKHQQAQNPRDDSERFGEINVDNTDNFITTVNTPDEKDDSQNNNNNVDIANTKIEDAMLGLPEQPDFNLPTTKARKSKWDQYLDELKQKRQRTHSPEKYFNRLSTKDENKPKVIATEDKLTQVQELPTVQDSNTVIEENNQRLVLPSNSNLPYNSEKQRDILSKTKKFIDDIKFKNRSPTSGLLSPSDFGQQLNKANLEMKLTPSNIEESQNYLKTLDEQNKPRNIERISQNLLTENPEAVGEPNPVNDLKSNYINHFLPTVSTNDGPIQVTAKPNTFLKYIEDIKAKRPTVSTLKPILNKQNSPEVGQHKNDVLKEKFKQFVSSLKTPLPSHSEPMLTPRSPEGLSEFNDTDNGSKPKHIFENGRKGALREIFKQYGDTLRATPDKGYTNKDILKDKIKKYAKTLNKTPLDDDAINYKPTLTIKDTDRISLGNSEKDVLTSRNPELFPRFNKLDDGVNQSFSGIAKKDALKEKFNKYFSSLIKPKKSSMNRPVDVKRFSELPRKSADAQTTDPIISELQPNQKLLKAEFPAVDNLNLNTELNDPANFKVDEFEKEKFKNNDPMTNPVKLGAPNPLAEQYIKTQDTTIQNRGSFSEGDDVTGWSNKLGKIVQHSSKPQDIFFIGNGIKLPLRINQGTDGTMDLSVDLDKLCSCQNSTCSKNNTAIGETVGAILEKEAELKDQLSSSEIRGTGINKMVVPKSLMGRFGDTIKSNRNSNIFKRSSDINGFQQELSTLRNALKSIQKDSSNVIQENAANILPIPKLPTFENVDNELTDMGKHLANSLSVSVHKLEDNVKNLNKEVVNALDAIHINPSINQETLLQNILDPNLQKIGDKTHEINKNILNRLEHQSNIGQLLKTSDISKASMLKESNFNINEYIKNLEREKTLKKLSQQFRLPQISTGNTLKQIENQANYVLKDMKRQQNKNKLKKIAAMNTNFLSTLPNTQSPVIFMNQLKESNIPAIPKLQSRVAEINENLSKMPDVYQYTKINALENKLKQLDNQVEKYEEDNEKLFADESQRFFGGYNNKIIQKEVNLISKAFSWLKDLKKPRNEK